MVMSFVEVARPVPLAHDMLASVAFAIADGDDRAVEDLVHATQGRLLRTATRIVRDADAAEDVVLTAYTRAICALRQGKFRFDAPVASWLDRIVTTGALDALRARRRTACAPAADEAESELVDGAPSPEDIAVARSETRVVAEAIAALPPRQREAILLTEIEGLSASEAAAALGCSRGAIELLLVRARRTLRDRVER
jgi:RNA polymerase sigma-70 factor (ECF subfamily)